MRFRYTALSRAAACATALVVSIQPAIAVGRFVPSDFTTIQAAIDASSAGDVVTVDTGTYTENVRLKSGVDVRGRETARTILQPADVADPVVLADSVDDVQFGTFMIIGAQVGVDVVDSTNLQIVNTVFDAVSQVGARIDVASQVDILNTVFWENAVAVRRSTVDAQITNSGFVGNTITITSPLGFFVDPNANVDNCGFFDNEDLKVGGVDTSLGAASVVGDPRFVATDAGDFHLREGSPFIDTGLGNDSIDNTLADIGAYGGQFADPFPFPLPAPSVSDASAASPPPYNIDVTWEQNFVYLVTNTTNPGSYRVYYQQNMSGPPYNGTDADNGTQPSPIEAGDATSTTLAALQPMAPAPAAPQLLTADPLNEAVSLAWTAVAEASTYRVHWGTASTDENETDVGDVTSFTVAGLTNGTSYVFAVSALRQPVYHISVTALDSTQNRNESDFSPESTLAIGPFTEGADSNQLSASPAVTIPYPDLPNKGCFVATAAWGADWIAEVQILRDFRDRFLATNRPGRAFVRWYYRHGPSAANWIANSDAARAVTRLLLTPLVVAALAMLGPSPALVAALVILSAALGLSIAGRRRFAVLMLALLAASPGVGAAEPTPWMFEFKGGLFEPDLPLYKEFYGDDRNAYFAGAFGYQFKRWLEVGGEIGYASDTGVGVQPGNSQLGGRVKYTLVPAHLFVNVLGKRSDEQLFVPYVGAGLTTAYYKQEVDTQSDRDGRTDLGYNARVGLQLLLNRLDPRTAYRVSPDGGFQSYLFLETQWFTTEVDGTDLGGIVYLLGLRFEWGKGRRDR